VYKNSSFHEVDVQQKKAGFVPWKHSIFEESVAISRFRLIKTNRLCSEDAVKLKTSVRRPTL
jgi:hypothetical protein